MRVVREIFLDPSRRKRGLLHPLADTFDQPRAAIILRRVDAPRNALDDAIPMQLARGAVHYEAVRLHEGMLASSYQASRVIGATRFDGADRDREVKTGGAGVGKQEKKMMLPRIGRRSGRN